MKAKGFYLGLPNPGQGRGFPHAMFLYSATVPSDGNKEMKKIVGIASVMTSLPEKNQKWWR